MSPRVILRTLSSKHVSATGIFAIPAVPYLHSLDLPKDELIQALGLSFTVSTIGLAAALIAVGKYELVAAGN